MDTTSSLFKCSKCGKEINSVYWDGDKILCHECYNESLKDKESNHGTNYQYGWICPKCGASLSPHTDSCPYCNPPIFKVTY